MDVLSNKQQKEYKSLSRYAKDYIYYNENDNKYIYEVGKHLSTSTEYTTHILSSGDSLDKLSLKYYGRPDLYWVIADFNRINDPFIDIYSKYNSLKIPTLSAIQFLVR